MTEASDQRWAPDFIGVGTIKSGTTWVYRVLREHPEVFMPSTKELQFFDQHYDRGDSWYRSFYASGRGLVTGEYSPQYLHNETAVSRLLTCSTDTRFLVSFRDPISRAYSHFMMDQRDSGMSMTAKVALFDKVVREPECKYLRFSRYSRQIGPLLDAVGSRRLHVIWFRDIQENPADVARRLFGFLGVDPSIRPPSLDVPENVSKEYRSRRLFQFLQGCVRLSERIGLRPVVERAKHGGVRDFILGALEVPAHYQPMSAPTQRFLEDLFVGETEKLGSLLGQVPRW